MASTGSADQVSASHARQHKKDIRVLSQSSTAEIPFDILVIPEELFPVQIVGTMVLDRNPDYFFAETEQAAFRHDEHSAPAAASPKTNCCR